MKTRLELPILDRPAATSAIATCESGDEQLLPEMGEFLDTPEHVEVCSKRSDSEHRGRQSSWKVRARSIGRLLGLPRSVIAAKRGLPQMPRVLTHTVTFGCNAKCVMCDSWKLSTAEDLTLDEIEGVYEQLPTLDAVRLTGGEPFVRKDLPQIYSIALAHTRPLMFHISSNGFLTERIVNFCETRDQSVPLELAISIDGVDDFHNEIRGNSQAWRTAWKTLTELTPRRRELNLSLTVNQTIATSDGMQQYELLHERLKPLQIEHHVVVAYAESATYSLERDRRIEKTDSEYQTFAELDARDLTRMLELAEQHAKSLPLHRRLARLYYLRGLRDRVLSGHSRRNPKCQALHTHLRLFPNGDVPVCQFNSQPVGNFREQSFEEIWRSAMAAEQRKWVRACVGCWAECEVVPSAVYTLDVLRS